MEPHPTIAREREREKVRKRDCPRRFSLPHCTLYRSSLKVARRDGRNAFLPVYPLPSAFPATTSSPLPLPRPPSQARRPHLGVPACAARKIHRVCGCCRPTSAARSVDSSHPSSRPHPTRRARRVNIDLRVAPSPCRSPPLPSAADSLLTGSERA